MISDAKAQKPPADPFYDLDAYVALPRVEGLRLAPDGRRLVVGVATPDRKNSSYIRALWEVDPEGGSPARRLTRSEKGESFAGFTPDGDLLFVSARPRPGADPDDDPKSALWLQPAGGGDPRVLAAPPGGVHGVKVSESGTVVLGSGLMPAAADVDGDKGIRSKRKDAGVSAILHEEAGVRYWDHDLGPERTRLLVAELAGEDELELRDLTGHAGRALDDITSWDIAPDGRTVVTTWAVAAPGGSQRHILVAIDVATGERRTLADDGDHDYDQPRISPDGARVAVVVARRSTAADNGDSWLVVIPVTGGEGRDLTAGWDRLPGDVRWTPDGAALVVSADDLGRSPLWRVDVASGEVSRLTRDSGAYTDPQVSPDGRWVYALRSAIDSAPAPVRVALTADSDPEFLTGPATAVTVPGRLEEITATAADGTPLRAWLALPPEGAPAPLLLWVHGGPQSSWNAWSWRWNPWIAVARGYAVLLPDPALSTGYGHDFIRRGWGAWGDAPFTDLMAITDAAEARPDIDADRVAALGGSFGGYMANWIAGHTDRFSAIVTHASLWALDQFAGTTDASYYWTREMTGDMVAAHSPHHFADAITTPMLAIHGDKDYRVPIGEGLRLWWTLMSGSELPHKFLYFPDENHWILKPGNARVWYETVLAFLDHHVNGKDWQRPDLLG
ncbi:S9 family peptidase [Winogradskya humida]|uniref:Peptidase S9 n=1 Tax=Winogradskya humida TaxID=113566 RepID=A0ABQ4A5F1_9ACTN|nr:alpha/beta fold hydrolase [Actinoplanes humidus]GIE26085.1 peptidase S9 [Actinoplanes humidus]